MSIETATRSPPQQLTLKLKRALGGRAGWSGVAVQVAFVIALAWMAYEIVVNARTNLETQHIASGFGFLRNTAGFDVSLSLIPYSGSDTYTRVFLVGLFNTLLVSVIGIFFATILGFIVALGRLSPNWLMSRVAGAYVELVRNLPLLFQMLFWYLAVLAALPAPQQSLSPVSGFFLNNRGMIVPTPVAQSGLDYFSFAILIAIVGSLILQSLRAARAVPAGPSIKIWPYVLGLFIGLPLLTVLVFGAPRVLRMACPERLQLRRRLAVGPGIRGADAGAHDLYRGFHRRDRSRRHPVGAQGTDGGRVCRWA